jgi:hypothetical protein
MRALDWPVDLVGSEIGCVGEPNPYEGQADIEP